MCPGKQKQGALFLILFSLFSNKQDTMSGKQQPNKTNDEYVKTLRDISAFSDYFSSS